MRPVLPPAALLATAGVAITAAVVGLAALVLFDLDATEAMQLGAIVGSTDAAAVFPTLRFTTLRRRLGAMLEAESGLNDPMAVALTLGMIEWVDSPGYGLAELLPRIGWALALGLASGLAIGAVASRLIARIPLAAGPFVPVVSAGLALVAFAAPESAASSPSTSSPSSSATRPTPSADRSPPTTEALTSLWSGRGDPGADPPRLTASSDVRTMAVRRSSGGWMT